MAKVKAKRKTGLDKFNNFLLIVLIIAIVGGGLYIGLSPAKVPVADAASSAEEDEIVIDEFKAGTYGGVKFDSVEDVVDYYVKAFDYTKALTAQYKDADGNTATWYKLLGGDDLSVEDIMIDGAKSNALDSLVPGIVGNLFSHALNGLPPCTNRTPNEDVDIDGESLMTSRLTADDILAANVTEKDGKIVLTLQPKLTELSVPGKDAQGHVFTTLGDITETVDKITVLKWAEGSTADNVKVSYKGGSAVVTIDPSTTEIVEADYHEVAYVSVTHATITVLRDKSASVTIRYDMHYPATDEYLMETKQCSRL